MFNIKSISRLPFFLRNREDPAPPLFSSPGPVKAAVKKSMKKVWIEQKVTFCGEGRVVRVRY